MIVQSHFSVIVQWHYQNCAVDNEYFNGEIQENLKILHVTPAGVNLRVTDEQFKFTRLHLSCISINLRDKDILKHSKRNNLNVTSITTLINSVKTELL